MAACGCDFTLAVMQDGSVFAWGRGADAQLGLPACEDRLAPARVGAAEFGDARISFVAAGEFHAAAVAESGDLWTWGRNSDGRLGHGDAERRVRPVRLGTVAFGGAPVINVACGEYHTIAVAGDGGVWGCGYNGSGQLGLGDGGDLRRLVFTRVARLDPERLGGDKIVLAAAGECHSVVVSARGSVFSFGHGGYGCLGHGDERDQKLPRQIAREQFAGANALVAAAGFAHTVVVTADAGLWVWGSGFRGQLGLGDSRNRVSPTRISNAAFEGSGVLMAACGFYHTLAVTEEDGGLWAWGFGQDGRLGLDDHRPHGHVLVPTRIAARHLNNTKVVSAAAGDRHSVAVLEDGAIYTWGYGGEGDEPGGLGHSALPDRDRAAVAGLPTRVGQAWLSGQRVGRYHTLAPDHALAFAMGTHARLGAGNGCAYSSMPTELLKRVVEACRWWPACGASKVPGAVRLMGGGRMRIV
eukprot:Tamp_10579.p1 GENE.Tamp_10579~~Tamp_10579.p1  ORF type:complete len:468 (-),score=54.70 Tamp_10579:235-1638(-)